MRTILVTSGQKSKSRPAEGKEKYPVKTGVLESARLWALPAGTAWTALRFWIGVGEEGRRVRKGVEWEIWDTGVGAGDREGTADTSLAEEGVKGAEAIGWGCC